MSKRPRTWQVSGDYEGSIFHDHGVVVMRGDQEVEFFHNEKDAGAWIQHVYGMTPRDARDKDITISPIRDRGPRPGDVVTYKGGGNAGYDYLLRDKTGEQVRDHVKGVLARDYGDDIWGITFGASSFRKGNMVDNGGGPTPATTDASLTFIGFVRHQFWRWSRGYAGGSQGGYYWLTVPHWEWNGDAPPR